MAGVRRSNVTLSHRDGRANYVLTFRNPDGRSLQGPGEGPESTPPPRPTRLSSPLDPTSTSLLASQPSQHVSSRYLTFSALLPLLHAIAAMWLLWFLLFLGLHGVRPSRAAQVTFLNITAPYQGFPSACISALNAVVSCDPKTVEAGRDGRFESDATLASVCTTACTDSLVSWRQSVTVACGSSRYQDGQAFVLAAALTQSVFERYSVLCLKR